jgi:hypothetical protein
MPLIEELIARVDRPSPHRSFKAFEDLPLPSRAEGHATPASNPKRELPPEVLKVFATVPDYLKVETCKNELGAGIDPTPGAYKPKFPPMTEAQLDACLAHIPNPASTWEQWNNIGMEIYAATDGADYGLAAWERWSVKNPKHAAGDAGCAERWGQYATSPPTRTGGGALVNKARAAQGDRKWLPPRQQASPSPAVTTGVTGPGQRKPLKGGEYERDEALGRINSHYLIGKTDEEIAIFRIKDDGSLAFTPPEQFKLDLANVFVTGGERRIAAEKFWKEHHQRHERTIVFKPGGTTEPHEFNLWRGYGVKARRGWQKQRRLLRHIREVICRRDKAKFKYLIRWLAWAVQNPDKNPEAVIVLKSRTEGTGKTTLGVVMHRIFGRHGTVLDDKERLLGRFNDWIEPMCFVLAEEILWAGDRKTADKLKSVITGSTIQIERKHGSCRSIPNRLHVIMTTNHDHAVAAGVGDRRFVVLELSDERAAIRPTSIVSTAIWMTEARLSS